MIVRPFTDADLSAADRVNRRAFGTFFGLADPMSFRGDGEVIPLRAANMADGAWVAEADGDLVGCVFGVDWGGVVVLGPLTVDPDAWGRGVARALMPPFLAAAEARRPAFIGLFTHPQSATHVRLYESFGFWMRGITGVMSKPVAPVAPAAAPGGAVLYSTLGEAARSEALAACRAIAGTMAPGLDLGRDIEAVCARGLGETVMVEDAAGIAAFALCHHGPGSDGGSGTFLVKFAAVRPGDRAAADFERLLAACEGLAATRTAPRIDAAANSARIAAYRALQARGFRTWMNGVVMIRPADAAYERPDLYCLDDWR